MEKYNFSYSFNLKWNFLNLKCVFYC